MAKAMTKYEDSSKGPIRLLFEQVSNRVYKTAQYAFNRVKITYTGLAEGVTVDESKVNYFLARSIMDGSVITDDVGNRYGENYVLASAFGAPVVNSMTAIMLANSPSVKATKNESRYPDFDSTMADWYKQNQSTIFDSVAASQAEGDAYIYIKNTFDADSVQLLPEYVEKIVDPNDYTRVIGYEVNTKKRAFDDKGNIIVEVYKTIYRVTYPYKVVIKYKTGNQEKDLIIEIDGEVVNIPIEKPQLYMETLAGLDDYRDLFDTAGRFEQRPLPIVPFHFKKKAQSVYGESVFRNLYVYFLNYHRVMDHMLRNVIFNLISLPYIKGVDNVEQFLRDNGELDRTTGEYKMKLDPRKVIFGGENFDIKMLTAPDTVGSAEKALKILFYLIVQASEMPEFFFGTAVTSSKASVKEQLPIVLNKGQRYQNVYTQQMINLFETVAWYKAHNGDVTVSPDADFDFSWGAITLEDTDSIIKLVELLDSMELVTDETKANILGLSKYVSDIKQEISDAKDETDTRGLTIDQTLIDSGEDDLNAEEEDALVNEEDDVQD